MEMINDSRISALIKNPSNWPNFRHIKRYTNIAENYYI